VDLGKGTKRPPTLRASKVLKKTPIIMETSASEHWAAEYNFWHKIISEEVERLRFNGGYEPFCVELYATGSADRLAYIGKTQIGHVSFNVTGRWARDQAGKKVLRVEILKAP
jgi:hypothetical protein